MPELPEVETIRMGLQKYLVGYRIVDVEVRLKKIVTGDTKQVTGATITGVRRFGKGLVIDLDNKYSIAIHIKMTGQLIFQRVSQEKVGRLPNKFTHVIFKLKTQSSNRKTKTQGLKLKNADVYLYYNDARQFGWIKIIQTEKLYDINFFKGLGPELPVLEQSSRQARTILTLTQFKKILSSSNQPIKVVIMDQTKMSGVGNIYANDGLWDAKINPKKKAKYLSEKEVQSLYDSLLKVLKKGLQYGGASELSYVNALGQEGEYQKHFLAYAQDKKPCKRCGTKIQKIRIAGRGTYFCPNCQNNVVIVVDKSIIKVIL